MSKNNSNIIQLDPNLNKSQKSKNSKKINLLVGVPAYNNLIHTDLFHTLLTFTNQYQQEIVTTVITLGNESLITRARNKIFSIFVDPKYNFDYLLFLDADIKILPQDVYRLIKYNVPIIGAPVRLKDLNRLVLNVGDIIDDMNFPIVKVSKIGNAVMLIQKSLALDIVKYAEENKWYYFHNPEYTRGDNIQNLKIYDVFRCGIKNGEYLSEDYWFCEIVKDLGYDILVDFSVHTVHNGSLQLHYDIGFFKAWKQGIESIENQSNQSNFIKFF